MNNQKFQIQVWIGKNLAHAISHRLTFSKNAPGRAQLTISGDAEPQQLVAIELGWGGNLRRVFTGFIERVAPAGKGHSLIFCRELAAVLYHPWHVVMRHPTLTTVIENLAVQTGLKFEVAQKSYADTSIPCFYSIGSGYRLLDELAQAFNIPDFIWQQQGDGIIFVGALGDSFWGQRSVEVPNDIMTAAQGLKSATMPCLPHLKPEMKVNGRRLATVEHTGVETKITWT